MNKQLFFLLSAIGGLNGLFLSVYFSFFIRNKSKSTYFLSALLLSVSIRITKSAFLYFNNTTFLLFIQIGLIACALIGPFLYLYIREEFAKKATSKYGWLLHLILPISILVILFYFHSYKNERVFWDYTIVWGIYSQWFVYILFAVFLVKDIFKKFFKREKLTNKEIWLLNLVVGIFIIWLAYRTTRYTSYVVGALSFSFVLYISFLLWIFKRKGKSLFFETEKKYKNTTISNDIAGEISEKLDVIFKKEKLYKNPNLKLNDLAEKFHVSPHQLSQFLNDNLQKSFNQYINEFRIDEAKELLKTNHQFTLEAIGNEAGFSSKSTFYSTFKKLVNVTPAQFRKQNLG